MGWGRKQIFAEMVGIGVISVTVRASTRKNKMTVFNFLILNFLTFECMTFECQII